MQRPEPTIKASWLTFFCQHKVLGHLIMVLMLIFGFWGFHKLNVQFLPTFDLPFVTVSVPWPHATPKDIEEGVIAPLERQLHDIDNVKRQWAGAREGTGTVVIELNGNANINKVYDDISQAVAKTILPNASKKPIVQRIDRFEPVASLLISGPSTLTGLRALTYEVESQLLKAGIGKIDILGLPNMQVLAQASLNTLLQNRQSLNTLAKQLQLNSQNLASGSFGNTAAPPSLRLTSQNTDLSNWQSSWIRLGPFAAWYPLGDSFSLSMQAMESAIKLFHNGQIASLLELKRSTHENTIAMANHLHQWLKNQNFGASAVFKVVDERWHYLQDRISLLLKNGGYGLGLIFILLLLFLTWRVAFWVSYGIPLAIITSLGVLYLLGSSINMISLFAMIMSLGIIVDDTIVIAEDAQAQFIAGASAQTAVMRAVRRMLIPVLAACGTTIAAFLPLLFVRGLIGQVLIAIPQVIIAVIIASLIECFIVLPFHLKGSFTRMGKLKKAKRQPIIQLERFTQGPFKKAVTLAIDHRMTTLIVTACMVVLAIMVLASNRLPFSFFQMPDTNLLRLNVGFVAGTSEDSVKQFLDHTQAELKHLAKNIKQQDGEDTLVASYSVVGRTADLNQTRRFDVGENYGYLYAELTLPDQRKISNQAFIERWQKRIKLPPKVNSFSLSAPRAGPPGRDIDVVLTGTNNQKLKTAAQTLKEQLMAMPGVNNIKDDAPYGQGLWGYELNAQGRHLGLSEQDLSGQISSAFAGVLVQRHIEGRDEIEMRLRLDSNVRDKMTDLSHWPIFLPNGQVVRFDQVATLKHQQNLEVIRHIRGASGIRVTADVNNTLTNPTQLRSQLAAHTLPTLAQRYGIKARFEGRAEEQAATFIDMQWGLVIGLILMYIILVAVFSSFLWPLWVMLIIPLGLAGAIFGHVIMGIHLSVLSLFGLFGLAGIVVNDSIILVSCYREYRQSHSVREALIGASCNRLRHVFLTSATTIVGLVPLLFETSVQAQFLIPMATSIVFGLIMTSLLILFLLPALLSLGSERA